MKEYKTNIPEITLKYKSGDVKKVKITNSHDANDILRNFYDQDTLELTESFLVLYLNKANNTIGWFKLSQGGLDACLVDKRLILATALKCGATSIIVSHNHPSNNTQPSNADINQTNKLNEACKILDMKLLDHIIITESNGFYSFADEGLI
mgnify:CR=1 FL=1